MNITFLIIIMAIAILAAILLRKQKQSDLDDAQVICPVMKTPLYGPTPYVVHHHGKPVYLCCPGCVDEFTKDPGRFM
jgi:YHS domain-containing protein